MTLSKSGARRMCIDAGLSRKAYARLKLREGMAKDAVELLISLHLKSANRK